MAQEFGRVAQDRFPVILLGEDEHCDSVPPAEIADDQIAGILYVLTYSERQRFSCITTYAVPVDPAKFADPHGIWLHACISSFCLFFEPWYIFMPM